MMRTNLIIVIWLYAALLPIERIAFGYRSIRDEIVTRDWTIAIDAAHYAAVGLVSLIAVLAVPLPVAIA